MAEIIEFNTKSRGKMESLWRRKRRISKKGNFLNSWYIRLIKHLSRNYLFLSSRTPAAAFVLPSPSPPVGGGDEEEDEGKEEFL